MNRRDDRIGEALEALDVPEHAPDFFTRLDAAFDDIDAEEASVTPLRRTRAARTGAPATRTARRPRRTFRLGLAASVAAFAVAAYALVTFAPGTVPDRIADSLRPQVASAAEVTEQVRRAVAETGTLRGVLVLVEREEPGAPTREMRWEFAATAEGDYRLSGENTMPDGTTIAEEIAYDASAGVERRLTDDGVFPMWTERTGLAPGAPDENAGDWVLERRLGALVQALAASEDGDVAESTHDGRDVWVLETTVSPNLIAALAADRIEVTVDRETGLPLRVVETRDGELVREMRLEALKAGVDLPETTFSLSVPDGVEVGRIDGGFRRVPIEDAEAAVGYAPLAPAWLPDGFELDTVAVAAETQSTGVEGMNPASRGVVSLLYRRGFEQLVVTTRRTGPEPGSWSDPLASGEGYRDEPESVTLGDGALRGASAELLVGAHALPHLWARDADLVVTVAGSASAEELVRIAESLGAGW